MRETILALLALSVVTTLSLSVVSASLQSNLNQIDRELEIYASSIATQVLDYASILSFDESTNPNNWLSTGLIDSTDFSFRASFGSSPSCNLYQPFTDTAICDDLDDLHMADSVWIPFEYVTDSLSFPFQVNTQVSYINPSLPDSILAGSVRTYTKQVVVTVKSALHVTDNRFGGSVQLKRMLTFDEDQAIEQANAAVPVCSSASTLQVSPLLSAIYINYHGASAGACP